MVDDGRSRWTEEFVSSCAYRADVGDGFKAQEGGS